MERCFDSPPFPLPQIVTQLFAQSTLSVGPPPEPLHQVEHRPVDVVPGLGLEPPLEGVGLRGLDDLELRVGDVEEEDAAPDFLELLLGPDTLPVVHELRELADGASVVVP